ncbi:uncharacterized protein LOC110443621 [Mizuhopecten yessoensis]|nr:uncharacterized protein LOC110443621 [Mizuhopecten yessoensis]
MKEAAMKQSGPVDVKSKVKTDKDEAAMNEAAMKQLGPVDVKSKVKTFQTDIDEAAKKSKNEPAFKRSRTVRVKPKAKTCREINIDAAVKKSKNEAATKQPGRVEVRTKVTTDIDDVVPREEASSRPGSALLADKWAIKVIRPNPFLRDVSLTKSWLKCAPQEENEELRLRNEERAQKFRELFFTRYIDQNCNAFRYKPSKSTLDVINQMRNARSPKPARSYDNIKVDMQDILPNFPTEVKEVLVPQCSGSGEVKSVTPDDQYARTKKQKKKGMKSRFFCCFGK